MTTDFAAPLSVRTLGVGRQIWNLANLRKQRALNRHEFYIAMRLVALAQGGMPLSYSAFLGTMRSTMPFFAVLQGSSVANPRPPQAAAAATPPTTQAPGATPAPAGSAATAGPWSVPVANVPLFLKQFKAQDANSDGYVEAPDAAGLFKKSGLPPQVRRGCCLVQRDRALLDPLPPPSRPAGAALHLAVV